MSKLTKTEIGALVSAISSKINDPINERNNQIREANDKAFKTSKPYRDLVKLLQLDPQEKWDYNIRTTFDLLKRLYGPEELPLEQGVSSTKIETEVILASIEARNIDELIEKIINKLTNK